MELTYDQLTALPASEGFYTLMCISNEVGGDLWGNAHWKGVRLVELLTRVGLKPGIRKVVFHADDGYTDSIQLDAALRPDTLLAYEMNGEVLPKERAENPPSVSGSFCLTRSASNVAPRWFACPVRSEATW